MKNLIANYMTNTPISIGKNSTLENAKKSLYEHGIHHLPVLDGGQLYGVISDRDIKLAYAVDGEKAKDLHVGDACTTDVYAVTQETPLNSVCQQMVERGIGCTLIVNDREKVIGIFTVTDACRALSKLD